MAARIATALLLIAGLVLTTNPAQADEQARIAVLEIQGPLEIRVLQTLSDRVRAGVLQAAPGTDYLVMGRENIALVAQDMGLDLSCLEGACEVETGRNIGAAFVVSGSLIQMDESWICSIKVHDTQSGALLQTDQTTGPTIKHILEGLKPLAARLMGAALGSPVQSKPPAQAAPQVTAAFRTAQPLGVAGKLREQECDQDGQSKGRASRVARFRAAAADAKAAARMAWQRRQAELEQCTQLDRSGRSICITELNHWLTSARAMRVTLPAGIETVQTDCGPRSPAFSEETRSVTAEDLPAAEALLDRLIGIQERTRPMDYDELEQHLSKFTAPDYGALGELAGCTIGSDDLSAIGYCVDGDFVGIYHIGWMLWARVEGSHYGFAQMSYVSLVEENFYGVIQFGLYSRAGSFYGMSQFGGWNRVDHKMVGSQVGIVNIAGKVRGIQLGLYNRAEHLRGVQIGVVNRVSENALPFMVGINAGF
jgi:hypothetical protein